MKKKLAFAILLLIAVLVMGLDLHWQMRVQRAVTGLLPINAGVSATFRSTAVDARWVVVKSEDVSGMLRAYNANRQLLAERTTPRLPIGQATASANAPIATLRTGGVEHDWHLVPRDDRLLRKYLELSTAPVATP